MFFDNRLSLLRYPAFSPYSEGDALTFIGEIGLEEDGGNGAGARGGRRGRAGGDGGGGDSISSMRCVHVPVDPPSAALLRYFLAFLEDALSSLPPPSSLSSLEELSSTSRTIVQRGQKGGRKGHARFISYLPLLRRLCSTLCAWPVDVLARAPAVLSLGTSLINHTAVVYMFPG